MFVDMALGTGRATRAERRNRKSGTIIRTAKNAGRVPAQKRGGKFHFSAVNSSFFRYPCVPPTPLQLSSVAMTSHTSLDGVPGA